MRGFSDRGRDDEGRRAEGGLGLAHDDPFALLEFALRLGSIDLVPGLVDILRNSRALDHFGDNHGVTLPQLLVVMLLGVEMAMAMVMRLGSSTRNESCRESGLDKSLHCGRFSRRYLT